MALANVYVQVYGQLAQFFEEICKGQAPSRFTVQHLKDLGFASSNHRALIPMLKELGFLTADGSPTQRYHDYRNREVSRSILGDALREAYSDIFVLRSHPTEKDRGVIEGKFKSVHNTGDRVAKLMSNTFFSLLALADIDSAGPAKVKPKEAEVGVPPPEPTPSHGPSPLRRVQSPSLHYNIQIHLPATKDLEVYNAIFKALKEHLLE